MEASQEYERQAIMLEIAKRAEEIADAEGRAKANKMNQEAQGELLRAKAEADAKLYAKQQEAAALLAMKQAEAEGMILEAKGKKALDEAIGENIIRMETIRNMDKIRFPHILVGSEAVSPLFDAIRRIVPPAAAPAPQPLRRSRPLPRRSRPLPNRTCDRDESAARHHRAGPCARRSGASGEPWL